MCPHIVYTFRPLDYLEVTGLLYRQAHPTIVFFIYVPIYFATPDPYNFMAVPTST